MVFLRYLCCLNQDVFEWNHSQLWILQSLRVILQYIFDDDFHDRLGLRHYYQNHPYIHLFALDGSFIWRVPNW